MKPALRNAAAWSAIALGFAIPVSTAASNLLLAMTVLFFCLSGDYREKYRAITDNPLALAVLTFCVVTALGCLYGPGSTADKLHSLSRYLTLLLVPVMVAVLSPQALRIKALAAFTAAMLLTLCLSYLIRFGWFPPDLLIAVRERDPAMWGVLNPVVFKLHITHGFLMAIAAVLLAFAALHARSRGQRLAAIAGCALAAINVLLMVKGRTGYAVLAILGSYFVYCRFGKKSLAAAAIGLVLFGAAAYQWSAPFHERVVLTLTEASQWQRGLGDQTSIGQRLEFYSNSLELIQAHPIIGVGTGGFEAAYAEQVRGTSMAPSSNPHNQYLMIAVQLGLAGLAGLAWLYLVYWRQAARMDAPFQQIARAVLLAVLVGNLFNSFMLDFTERMFFAWISGVLFAELSAHPAASGANS
ncbi:MAG: O-antigen ligase family protein [Proteobacteria bacterium]|nr:O-antigen ligase family protein [Pseudomonadota bacterium]